MAETLLECIGLYKHQLISYFINSPDILELMLGEGYTQEDVFGNGLSTNNTGIIYNQIFPYLYFDNTQTSVKSYLCIDVDIPKIPTNIIKDINLIIWIYCHKDCMQYSKEEYLGIRYDILSHMVEKQLRNSDKFGIGKLNLESATHMTLNSSYYGRQLIFTIPNFKISR